MASDGTSLSFGIKTSQAGLGYAEILRVWREADRVPEFQDAWLWDHLVPLRGDVTGAALEAWTLLAALAAQTSRLRLGVIVTSNRIRPPAVLAKMAATVDVIAAGRLVFGIGAGGSAIGDPGYAQLVHREYDPYGIDVVPVDEALADLAETCTLVKRLWSEEKPFDFDGRRYRLRGAVCEPKPVQRPHPPIMIGSGGERHGLRIVAEHADIWSSPTFTAPDFRRKSAVLDDHCAAIGRDPVEITRSVQVFFTSQEPPSGTARHPGPAAARELLAELIDAGARHCVLSCIDIPSAQWVADEVIRPVRAMTGHDGRLLVLLLDQGRLLSRSRGGSRWRAGGGRSRSVRGRVPGSWPRRGWRHGRPGRSSARRGRAGSVPDLPRSPGQRPGIRPRSARPGDRPGGACRR
jgi:alkanesulfonate monooxygenase SsuD/methylene tetrahydromethanopterin reductase-like flavin-dependent oxidoreductase (luciferase family)